MLKKSVPLLASVVILFCINLSAFACTEIHFKDKQAVISAHTMDWYTPKWFVTINPRGLKHNGWTSKYGSVTIGIVPRASPDGMNEKGLTAAALWLGITQYPTKDSRRKLSVPFWAQYVLDNFATVDEVIANAPKIRLVTAKYKKMTIKIHLIIGDPTGNTAILEYVDGNLVIHQANPLSIPVLTNNTYANSLTYLKQYQGFGGKLPIPTDYTSKSRFVRAAYFWKHHRQAKSLQQAMAIAFNGMNYVTQPVTIKHNTWEENIKADSSPTQWMIARDLTHKILEFKSINNHKIRTIDFKQINFSKGQPIKVLSINAEVYGNVLKDFKVLKTTTHSASTAE